MFRIIVDFLKCVLETATLTSVPTSNFWEFAQRHHSDIQQSSTTGDSPVMVQGSFLAVIVGTNPRALH